MLGIPLKYNVRNLFVRKVTTSLTVLGIGLVVAVFLCVMSLGEGLTRVFTASGSESNVLVLRQNSQSELQSGISRDQVPLILTLPGIAPDADGKPLASPELVVVLNLEKAGGGSSNVTIRGIGEKGMKLRPGLTLVEGRWFAPGKSEVVVSKSVSKRFKDCTTGQTIRFGAYRWTVVGLFDAGGTAPDSEIWTDVEGMITDFKRAATRPSSRRRPAAPRATSSSPDSRATRVSRSRARSSASTTTTRPPRPPRSSSSDSSSGSSWRSAPASAR